MSSATASQSQASVLISGAGPSGLFLALTLLENGVPVRIIEKDTQFHAGQRGAGIHPRTLEVYHYLGALEDILKSGASNKKRCIYEMPGGVKPARIHDMTPYSPPTPSVPYRNPVILGQAHAEEILRGHLAKYDTYVELNTELVDFEQDSNGVTAHIVKRTGGQEVQETLSVGWLVGAEGARSLVRRKLDLAFEGVTREEERMIVVDLVVKNLSTEYWHSWGDQLTQFIYLRPTESQDVFSLMAGGHEADLDPLLQGRDEIAKFIRRVTNRNNLEFGEVQWVSDFRHNIRMVSQFGKGRVFLVGDAAHVHSPMGGQGMNSGAQDAFNLGWKISLVHKGLAAPSLLDTYTAERLPVIREMLARTTALLEQTLKFRADGSNTAGLDRPRILHQLGVHCRESPIVVDEQPDAKEAAKASAYLEEDPSVLYAGDRAPDAPALRVVAASAGWKERDETSLFKVFGPTHHTVLLFATVEDDHDAHLQVADSLRSYSPGTFTIMSILPQATDFVPLRMIEGTDLVVVDTAGHAFTAYPPVSSGFSVVIVRPDGVVGAVVRGLVGVKQYLANVLIR